MLDVARWVRDELATLRASAFPEDVGIEGAAHLRADGARDSVRRWPRIQPDRGDTRGRKHAKAATVERSVAARGRRMYVDYLQNIRGKTLASAYSARANAFAGVSAPLTWDEVEQGVSPEDFTLPTFGAGSMMSAICGRDSSGRKAWILSDHGGPSAARPRQASAREVI